MKYIEFHMLDVAPNIEYTVTVPSDMTAGEVAKLLMPHMKRSIVSDVREAGGPSDSRLDECMDLVFNFSDPCMNLTEEDAAGIIQKMKDDGIDVPEMLTPFLFLELYNDLEPEKGDD